MDPSLIPFFEPRGVVGIGVSRDPSKLGYILARNLAQSGYCGAVHYVNPRGGELFGHPIYKDVREVPDPVDLAVMFAPAAAVPGVLEACGQRGIRAAIVPTGGFRECGPEGAALEEQMMEVVRRYGMRIIGPNCVGIQDMHLPLDTTFLQPPMPPIGEVALLSHSGALAFAIIDWMRGQGMGLSRLYSLGNQADVNETDLIGRVAEDPKTSVLTMYIEALQAGPRFVKEASLVTAKKPIVVVKVGASEAGRRAAESHTGALAGTDAAYDAAFRRAGVQRASSTEQMFNIAKALAWCPLLNGTRIAILTNAGGPGVIATDALEKVGLTLAKLSDDTRRKLAERLPAAASVKNPVDMIAGAGPEEFAGCLQLLIDDEGVDGILVNFLAPPASTAGMVAKGLIPVIQCSDKPVVVSLMGQRRIPEAIEYLRAMKIAEYRFPEQAVDALAALYERSQILKTDQSLIEIRGLDRGKAAGLLDGQPAGEFLPAETAFDLLEAYGLSVPVPRLAASADEAVKLADQAGYPVVLKVASADIPHKSDIGGVKLDLADGKAVRAAYEEILARAAAARPDARLDGAHVQRMLTPGQEVIVGMVRDPQFGPLVMFGSGGVEVEGLKDVAFALAPLTRADAGYLLEKTWAGRKLRGFRHLEPADREAVLDAMARLGQLASDFPHIAEMEINPLRVFPEGQGAAALDVRIRLA